MKAERIRELAEQAGFETYGCGRFGTPEFGEYIKHGAMEKFIELVAQEAIKVCEDLRSSGENKDSWTITRDMAFYDCKTAIAEYFGIKKDSVE